MNIIGNARNNVLTDVEGLFGRTDDFIFAGKGKDNIISLAGQDRIYAGAGDDTVDVYGNRDVFASGGKGYDILTVHITGNEWWNDPQNPHTPPEVLGRYKGFEEVHFDFS